MFKKTGLKKEITFIYMDAAEKAIYKPIYREAKYRGYKVRMTDNKFARCEIGFYCQHVNFPQYSKFSVIMLHDATQQYGNWPDIWLREPWHKYDVGIIPGKKWIDNWEKCSQWFYARPRLGMYEIGWTKADDIVKFQEKTYQEDFYIKYGLDMSKRTVLYAPAWENDHKQDDFVREMKKLDVNILVKQSPSPPDKFPDLCREIVAMAELHKNDRRVTLLPVTMNIFEAIAASDVLVSEESSTMCEAVMMGIPAVSVSNWLIPDVTPSRFPACNYEFVTHTTKEQLAVCVQGILDDYDIHQKKAREYSTHNFGEIGHAAPKVMDIVDDCVNSDKIRYPEIKESQKQRLSLKRYLRFQGIQFTRQLQENYVVQYKPFIVLWYVLKFMYRPFKKFIKL